MKMSSSPAAAAPGITDRQLTPPIPGTPTRQEPAKPSHRKNKWLFKFSLAVIHRFKKMLVGDVFAAGEVGDGSGDLEDPIISPGTQFEPRNRIAQQLTTGSIDSTIFAQVPAVHRRIAAAPPAETLLLKRTRPDHPVPDRRTRFPVRR